jgi:Arc/MetJ-type ribon-helix-helix transcriptional regulator
MAGMATEKITVTVPAEVLESARAAVASGAASSVSAYVSQAVRDRAERERHMAAVEDRWGPFDDEATDWARQIFENIDGDTRRR